MGFSSEINHAIVFFNHLDRMGKEVNEIFKKEYKDGNISGALPSSKIENFWATTAWLEVLLAPYLKEKQYIDKRKELMAKHDEAKKAQDLGGQFEAARDWACYLVLEAYTQGFMMTQRVGGDYVVDLRKKGEEEEAPEGGSEDD